MYVPLYLSWNKPTCYFTPCLSSLSHDIIQVADPDCKGTCKKWVMEKMAAEDGGIDFIFITPYRVSGSGSKPARKHSNRCKTTVC